MAIHSSETRSWTCDLPATIYTDLGEKITKDDLAWFDSTLPDWCQKVKAIKDVCSADFCDVCENFIKSYDFEGRQVVTDRSVPYDNEDPTTHK